jgi:mono/diheme cytochrome c family protein
LRTTRIHFPEAKRALAGAIIVLGLAAPAHADEPKAPKAFDVKSTFRNICGFCHEDYGRKAGKGPQLMNSERSDDYLFNRIKNGLPGRMAAFSSAFSDDNIHQIVKFIRNLKPGEEPQNPS